MKRALVLTLALMLLVTAASAANLSESGFPVVVGEPATLTLLKAEDTLVTDFEVNAFTQYVEENCNVNLDFTLLPASDAASKLQLMISPFSINNFNSTMVQFWDSATSLSIAI